MDVFEVVEAIGAAAVTYCHAVVAEVVAVRSIILNIITRPGHHVHAEATLRLNSPVRLPQTQSPLSLKGALQLCVLLCVLRLLLLQLLLACGLETCHLALVRVGERRRHAAHETVGRRSGDVIVVCCCRHADPNMGGALRLKMQRRWWWTRSEDLRTRYRGCACYGRVQPITMTLLGILNIIGNYKNINYFRTET